MKAYIFLADGFEEVEALTVVDILRRASINIYMVSVKEKMVTGSHRIAVESNLLMGELSTDEEDLLILPGGPGINNLLECKELINLLIEHNEHNGKIGAICAAPSVLGVHGILHGKEAVCYPGFEEKLIGANVKYDPVLTYKNIITSRGLGTALTFALEIVKQLKGEEEFSRIQKSVLDMNTINN